MNNKAIGQDVTDIMTVKKAIEVLTNRQYDIDNMVSVMRESRLDEYKAIEVIIDKLEELETENKDMKEILRILKIKTQK